MGAALLILAAAAGACREDEPVARLEVAPTALRLPYGGFGRLQLRWEVLSPLEGASGRPLVFLHLLDRPGSVVRTFDHPLPSGWREGESVEYEVLLAQSMLAPPLPPGSYLLTAGLYDGAGRRWPLETGGKEVDDGEYQVGEVEMPAADGEEPMFTFSPSWQSTEPVADRQVLARRWLAGEGTIGIEGLSGPSTLLLTLRMAEPDERQERRVPEGGASSVRVASPCAAMEVSVSGPGVHEVLLPLRPPAGEGCEIALRPSFVLEARDGSTRRSVALETLAVRPEGAEAR